MTGEELGTLLGDAVSELEGASLTIDECIGQLLIGEVTITNDETDDDLDGEGLRMTASEFNEQLGVVANGLDSLIADIESVKDILLSIDANNLFANEEAIE